MAFWSRSRLSSFRLGLFWGLVFAHVVSACHSAPKSPSAAPESPRACEERRALFLEFLEALPERSVANAGAVDLPLTTLGVSPGVGPVFEVSAQKVVLDGTPLSESSLEARVQRFASWVSERFLSGATGKPVLYVAAAADLEVRTLRAYLAHVPQHVQLKLLVRTHVGPLPDDVDRREALSVARELLAEQNSERRAARALEAYQRFASCAAFGSTLKETANAPREERWPTRRRALLDATSRCHCSELDTESLRLVASAEQRAGAAGLGALPADFLRDHRCEASMPLRSIGKLVTQLESFDAEFAGDWQNDALRFEEVLSNERLLNYFCNALPGEALAAWQRARATVYFRPAPGVPCQAWRFEPLAPGAPLGTLRRVTQAGQAPLAFHYRQAAEELIFFGPVPDNEPTRPTDARKWACEQKHSLLSVDARSIETETVRFFLEERACLAAPAKADTGCASTLAASVAP